MSHGHPRTLSVTALHHYGVMACLNWLGRDELMC